MMITDSIEAMRIFSQFTEGVHSQKIGDKEYAFIDGYAFPLHVASAICLWNIVGHIVYASLIDKRSKQHCIAINSHDPKVKESQDVWYYFYQKIGESMRKWDPVYFDHALKEMSIP